METILYDNWRDIGDNDNVDFASSKEKNAGDKESGLHYSPFS